MARIKNWHVFQHYSPKVRKAPPWIKLHHGLLDDKDWFRLQPEAAKFLISLWLIASEDEGNIPDSDTLAFRLRLSIKDVEKLLNACSDWVLDDASNALADCKQLAMLEGEEKEKEKRENAVAFDPVSALSVHGVSSDLAKEWFAVRKAKKGVAVSQRVIDGLVREANLVGITATQAIVRCCERGWLTFDHTYTSGGNGASPPVAKPYRGSEI